MSNPLLAIFVATLVFAPAGQVAEDSFLGFRLGEEVRYALEWEGGAGGPAVQWTLRLEAIDESAATGVFDLTYLDLTRAGGAPRAQAIAEVVINAYGFPLEVNFTSERTTAAGNVGYTIEYLYDEDKYRKELTGGKFKDQEVKLGDYPGIRTSVPSGLYLYTPIDADCARAFAVAARRVEQGNAGRGATSGGGTDEIEEICRGRELIFANPGLLNLTMPSLWEAGTGTLDFFVLAPTGMRLDLLMGNPAQRSSPLAVGGIPIAVLLGGGPNAFNDAEIAVQDFRLVAGDDPLQLDLGGRTVDVWKLDVPAPFSAVYVDGNGSIARLDLPEDPVTGARAWIRRLRPSEY